MSSVADAISLLTSSDETYTNVCAPCNYGGHQREATHFCNSCQELLCAGCTEAHKGMKISRNHKIVSAANILKESADTTYSCQVPCDCNQNQVVVEYCEDHDEVICQACKTLKHRRCETTAIEVKSRYYNSENLAVIAQKLRRMCEEIDQLLNDKSAAHRKITTMKEICKKEIKSFRKELNAFFDLLTLNSLKELETIEIREREETERQLSTLLTAKQLFHTHDILLQDAKKSSGKNDLYSADVKISKHLKDYEALLKDIYQEMKPPVLEFKRIKELTYIKTKLTSLGTLRGSHEIGAQPKHKSFLNFKIDSTRSSQIDIKLRDDKAIPFITGCNVTSDNQVLLCDRNNKSIKMLSSNLTMKDHLYLPVGPWDVSVINNNRAISTLPDSKQLQYLELAPRLKTGRVLQLDEMCWGVDVAGEEIYVTCHDNSCNNPKGAVRCLDMNGNLKRRLGVCQDGSWMFYLPFHLTVSTVSGKIFVSDSQTDTVTCLKSDGSVVYRYNDPHLRWPRGVRVDDKDHIILCSQDSNTIQVVTATGKQQQLLLTEKDGIQKPYSVVYRHTDGTLIIGCCSNNLLLSKLTA